MVRALRPDVYGGNRLPITDWSRKNPDEGLQHARQAGVLVTWLGGHPSLSIGPLLEPHKHDIGDVLSKSLEHEAAALEATSALLDLVLGPDVLLEEYACDTIAGELRRQSEVNKMPRRPGQTETFTE